MFAAPLVVGLLAAITADLSAVDKSLAARQYSSALTALQGVPESERTAAWYLFASKAYDGLNDASKAVAMAQAAIERNPTDEFARLQLAQIFLSRNTPEAAYEILGDARQDFPHSILIRLGLGLALKEMRRYEEADGELRECLRIQPHLGTAFDALGGALLELTRYEELCDAARQYISNNPNDYRGYYYLAAGAEKLDGQSSEIQSSLRHCLELNPDFAAAHTLMGKVLLEAGNTNAAIGELERATHLRPDYSAAHLYLSRAYASAGRKQDAQRENAELARLNEQQSRPVPHLLYHRGLAVTGKGSAGTSEKQ